MRKIWIFIKNSFFFIICFMLFCACDYFTYKGINDEVKYSVLNCIKMFGGTFLSIILFFFIYKLASSNNIKEIVNTNKINKFCILGLILMTPGIYILHQKIFILILELQGKVLIAEPLKITCISNMIIDAIYAAIFAPILEEVLFRMCATAFYSTKWGKLSGVIFAALIFGWGHSGTWHRVECMILGVIWGIIFVFTGKIIYTMVIHGTVNLMITLLGIAKLKGCSAIVFRQNFLECNWTLIISMLMISIIGVAIFIKGKRYESMNLFEHM